MVTGAVEDYLKAIYKLQQSGAPATTNAIAGQMGLRAASVTAMLQQLSKQGMAEYTPRRGVYLTEGGLSAALRVIRRHRLIELYLNQRLAVPWDRVDAEAERLEHAISPYLEERIDAALGFPSFDPHGAPIPSSTGALPSRELVSLYDLPPNTHAVVRHIPDDSPELLRYAASLGLVPDAIVTVVSHDPITHDLSLRVSPTPTTGKKTAASAHSIKPEVARQIFTARPNESA